MSPGNGIPNAWDDDYDVTLASNAAKPVPTTAKPTSRAQRKAQHVEANKALWDSAENPEPFHFVDVRNNVPLKSAPKAAMQVLSRKPKQESQKPAGMTPSPSIINGVGQLDLNNEEDIDSEEEERRSKERNLKERQEQARIEREEKHRRYKEVRERLFGSNQDAAAKSSSSNNASPSRSESNQFHRGARGGQKPNRRRGVPSSPQESSSTEQSPARGPTRGSQQLYEPEYSPRPALNCEQGLHTGAGTPQTPSKPVRQPRGPGGNGFGFAARDVKTNMT